MSNISKTDKNFKVATNIGKSDVSFFDVLDAPFKIYGVFFKDGFFRRLHEDIAKSVSENVRVLHTHTAGGRVRFKTDSPYVAISAKLGEIGRMPHFALSGSAGFDLYVKENGKDRYVNSFIPPYNMKDGYEGVINFIEGSQMRELTVNFPLYSEVKELYVGIASGSQLLSADGYEKMLPVVYYGSSITQGGCASRPGNAYQAIISRRFNIDFVNLGFSGSAKGEEPIAKYVSGLDMSLFVYDYDHNAPNVPHLEATHEKMFNMVRGAHPDIPIIMLTRPKIYLNEDEKGRLETVKRTYENALARGDKNVYFISGAELMKYTENDGSVDNCHPNDLGFYSMARVLGDLMEKIYNGEGK